MINESEVTIVIPFLRSNKDRFLNLKCVLDSLTNTNIKTIIVEQKQTNRSIEKFINKFYKNIKYIKCDLNTEMINKSMLVNTGVKNSNTKYIWQVDCDVVLKWAKVLESIPKNKKVIKPFNYIIKLTKDDTLYYRKHGKITIKKGEKRDTIKKFGPMSFIIEKNIYLSEDGMDERFEGWSWEDIAFANKIIKKYDIYECEQIIGAHLYHPPAISNEHINRPLLLNSSNDDIIEIDWI